MADNITLNVGTGGAILAADDVTSVWYQIIKLAYGALDTATLVSTSAGLPVAQQGTWNVTNVSGTVSLPTGASTAAKQPALGTAGVASADVITIQGVASMTKLLVTPDSVALPANQSVNVAQINGVTTLMGAGNTGTGSQRVTIASDQAVIPVSDNAGSITVDAPVGTPVFASLTPSTTGGWSTFMATSADGSTALTATAQVIKASAGVLGGWYIYNPNATATYVIIYNVAAASVTVGTTNPQMAICIPATSAANVEFANGIAFTNAGWSVAATTTGGGNTAPGTALEANFFYK